MALAHSAHAQSNRNLHVEYNLIQRQHPEPHFLADPVLPLTLVAFNPELSHIYREYKEQSNGVIYKGT